MVGKEIVSEREVHEEGNFFVAGIVLVLLIAIGLVAIYNFNFQGFNLFLFIVFMVVFYFIILSFLLEPRRIREIKSIFTQQITVDRPVIREIEKQVIKTVDRPIIKHIFLEKKEPMKFRYVGSTETKKYHLASCRLGKLIKEKYKLQDNDEMYFKRLRYKPCKNCIKK